MPLGRIDETGLVLPRLPEIEAYLRQQFRNTHGDAIDLGPDGPFGQLIGAMAVSALPPFELLQALYDSLDPDSASGVLLDNFLSAVGLQRESGRRAAATAVMRGDPGVEVAAGRIVQSPQGVPFVTLVSFVIPSAVAPATLGEIAIPIEAEEVGALSAPVGLYEIQTSVFGWTQCEVLVEGVEGRAPESDSAARIRRRQSFQRPGASTIGSIRAHVLALDHVDAARALTNRSNVIDGDLLPPKSFRIVVWPDGQTSVQEQAIVQAIFEKMPAGIESDGDITYEVEDADENSHEVSFSYATAVPMGIRITITKKTAEFPANGVELAYAAAAAVFTGLSDNDAAADPDLAEIVGAGLDPGDDVHTLTLARAVGSVPGVKAVSIQLDRKATSDPPVGTGDAAIGSSEIATLDDNEDPTSGDLQVTVA